MYFNILVNYCTHILLLLAAIVSAAAECAVVIVIVATITECHKWDQTVR